MIYSFDIFDTILTRVVAEPEDIFYLTGKDAINKKLWTKTAEEFKTARINAEQKSRIDKLNSETTFEEIYNTLQKDTNIDIDIVLKIASLEISREEWAIRPIEIIREQIYKARQNCLSGILFISDMYLPSEFLKKMLIRYNFFNENDQIFISCEHKATKKNGSLYKKIKHDLGINKKWVHIGNSYDSDFLMAKKENISAIYFGQGNLNKYEKILLKNWKIEYSFLAGISRIVRLKNIHEDKRGQIIYDISANVVAPCLIAYTLWCLNKAKELNFNTLFFSSRDGEVLLDIAKNLYKTSHLPFKIDYLYGSRHVWHRAGLRNLEKSPDGIFGSLYYKDPTLNDILERFNVTYDDLSKYLKCQGIFISDINKKVEKKEELIKVLQNYEVKKIISEKNKDHIAFSLEYLTLKEVFSYKNGFVDLGWNGNVLKSINELNDKFEGQNLTGLFWGIKDNNEFQISYTNQKSRHYWQLEMFCSGTHGTVLGFNKINDKIVPLFKENHNIRVLNWGLKYLREAVDIYSKEVSLILEDIGFIPFENLSNLICEFTERPTRDEAIYWGDFPYEEDQAGRIIKSVAPKLTFKEHLNYLIGRHRFNLGKYEWPEARLYRSYNPFFWVKIKCRTLYFLVSNKY